MKHLLRSPALFLFLLFFTGGLARGAVPAFTTFLGTNGIIVKSNAPNGKILIDGINIAGTNYNPNQFAISSKIVSTKTGASTTNPVVYVTQGDATQFLQPYWTNDSVATGRHQLVDSNQIPLFTIRNTNDATVPHHAILYIGGGNPITATDKRFEGIIFLLPDIFTENGGPDFSSVAFNWTDTFAYSFKEMRFQVANPSALGFFNTFSNNSAFTVQSYSDDNWATRLQGKDLLFATTARSTFGISNVVINQTIGTSVANTLAKFAGTSGGIIQTSSVVALGDDSLTVIGTLTNRGQVYSGTVVTNTFLYLGSGGVVQTGAFSTGLTFSGGTLTSSGGAGTPGGLDMNIQFAQGAGPVFAGTNDFRYDRTNRVLKLIGAAPEFRVEDPNVLLTNYFNQDGFGQRGLNAGFSLTVSNRPVWRWDPFGHLVPGTNAAYNIGSETAIANTGTNRVGTGYFTTVDATNYLTKATPLAGIGTNLVADGSIASKFTNSMNQNGNLIFTNLQSGIAVDVHLFVSNGVTAQVFSMAGAAPATSFYDGNTVLLSNAWNRVLAWREGTITNFLIINKGFDLAFSENVSAFTNYPAGAIRIQGRFTVHTNTVLVGTGTNFNLTNITAVLIGDTIHLQANAASSGSTQMVVAAAGNLTMTNQITYIPLEYNGSNTVNNYAWDMSLNTFKPVTNFVNTNMVFTLSNITKSASLISEFIGNPGTTNTILIQATSGVNIKWKGWNTNVNSGGILVRGGYSYTFQAFADRATNVSAWVTTDDPYAVGPIISIVTNDLVINTRYTNTASTVSYVQCSMTLNASVTDIAQAVLMIDQNADGTYDTFMTNRIGSGVAMADSILVGGWVTNGGFFTITNQSTGSATATINPNSSQRISGFGTGPQGLTGATGATGASAVPTFNYLPQSQTNYLPAQDRRMAWGKYDPNGTTVPVGLGTLGAPASPSGSLQADREASETNSHYGVIRATGGTIQAGLQANFTQGLFIPTNRVFMFTATLGFSNAPGTNEMHMEVANLNVFSFASAFARLGWFAETAGSSQTNWVAQYRSNNTAQITVHTSTAMTDQWHTLGIGNTNGNTLVWYMDGVPVASVVGSGIASPGGLGAAPVIGERITLSPNGTNFMFWQDFELLHEKTTPVGTGPL